MGEAILASSLILALRTLSHNSDAIHAMASDQAPATRGPGGDIAPDRPEAKLALSLIEAYGNNGGLLTAKAGRLADQCQAFAQRFGDGPVRILRAPARINILGEHVDYVSYLPTASLTFGSREHDMVMMFRPSPTGLVRGASTDSRFQAFEFDIRTGPVGSDIDTVESEWLSFLYSRAVPAPGWANYVIGACSFARLKYGDRITKGFDFLIDSSLPAGSGASSSSALSCVSGAAARLANTVEYEPAELAMDSSRAEWYVGTRGGSMDHITICGSRPGSAISISYSNRRSTIVPLGYAGYSWITFFTHPANKGQEVMNQYNDRAFVSRILIPAILEDWRSTRPDLSRLIVRGIEELESGIGGLASIEGALGELPETSELEQMRKSYPAVFEECHSLFPALVGERSQGDFRVRNRALHHVGEVERVDRAGQVLRSAEGREGIGPADATMKMLGELLNECHLSLRDLYDVSTGEVEEAVKIIADSGLALGARMMGGGFGGNVLALAREAKVGALIDLVQQKYYLPRDRDGLREGSIMVSTPGLGLSEIKVG
jgi:N-acetylgalactosamine kinase